MTEEIETVQSQAEMGNEQALWHRIIIVGLILMTVLVPLFFAPIFPEYGTPKQVLVKILTISLALVWVVGMALEGEIRIVDTSLNYVFIGFLAVSFISLFQSYNIFQGLDTLFQYFCYFLLVILVIHTVREMDQIYRIAITMATTGSLVAIIGLLQHNRIYDFFAPWPLTVSTIGNVNFVAEYYNVVFPVSLALVFGLKRLRYQALMALACFFMVCHLIVLGSRGGWLGAFVVFGVLGSAALFKHFHVGRRVVDVGLASVVVLGLGWPVVSGMVSDVYIGSGRTLGGLTQSYWQSTVERIESAVRLEDDSSQQRVSLWEDTLRLIWDRPVVGVGVGNFEYNIPKYMSEQSLEVKRRMEVRTGQEMMAFRAHNEYLEVWAEAGILGFVAFGILLFYIVSTLYMLFKQYTQGKGDFLTVGLIAAVVASLVHSFFSSNLQDPASAMHFWLIVGILWTLRMNIEGRPSLRLLRTDAGRRSFGLITAGGTVWVLVIYVGIQTLLGDYYHYRGKVRFNQYKDWAGSEREWKQSVHHMPSKRFEVYQSLGTALYNQGAWIEAVDAYQKSLYYHRNNATVYAYMGKGLVKMGRAEDGLAPLVQATTLNSFSPDFRLWLGEALVQTGQYQKAIATLQEVLQLDPDPSEAYLLLGIGHRHLGDLDGAMDAYQKGLDLHPNDPDLLNNLARVYSERQDFEAAGPIYAQLVREWPDNSDYLSNLGIVQLVLGNYEAAYQTGLKVIQMDPGHPGGYVVVGQILHASGKVDQAREVYQEGLRQNPDHQKLRALLQALASTNG